MPEKCEAIVGGNRCGFNAEWEIVVISDGLDDNTTYLTCGRHIGAVMEQEQIDRAEVEKL